MLYTPSPVERLLIYPRRNDIIIRARARALPRPACLFLYVCTPYQRASLRLKIKKKNSNTEFTAAGRRGGSLYFSIEVCTKPIKNKTPGCISALVYTYIRTDGGEGGGGGVVQQLSGNGVRG